jgi:hypothetical protein
MTKATLSDGQKYRLAQAQKILDLFEEANGRPANNVRELELWVASPEARATLDKSHGKDGKIIP